jgi:hypothetical protein
MAIKFIPVYYEGHTFLVASVTAFPVTQHHIPEEFKSIYKFILEQITKVQKGRRGELYCFFHLGARWCGWSTPRPGRFTPGKEPVPIV